jgi:hypothetical protein
MSNTVSILYRVRLQGGFNSAGTPKNNKELVIARVTTTDVQSGLETFTATDLGLETIDYIHPHILDNVGSVPNVSATTSVTVEYSENGSQLVFSDVAAAGDRAAITNDEDPVVQILAVGDSSAADV